MAIQDLVNKYTAILNDLPKEREKIALTIANEGKALAASRIQNEGINSDGQKMPLYSKKAKAKQFLHMKTSGNIMECLWTKEPQHSPVICGRMLLLK